MADKKRLSCKVCGEKTDDLVTHLEQMAEDQDHIDAVGHSEGLLVGYILKYDVEEKDLVHPDYKADEDPKPKTKKAAASSTSVEIAGVTMPKGSGGDLVPKANDAYHFGEVANGVCLDILDDKKIMLIGHTGTGKTSMVEQIASRVNQNVLRVNVNGQTTIGDFVGMYSVKGGETIWIDGALPKAMREGYWLIIDELDFAEPAILSVLNAVLERNGKLMLKEKGCEIVTPHKDFRLFATANGVGKMVVYRHLYQGVNLMNEAFLDRWRCYLVDYMTPEDEVKVLIASIPKLAANPATSKSIATVVVKVGNMIREAFKKEEVTCTFSLRRMLDWTENLVRYKDPLKAAEHSIFAKVTPEDGEVIKQIIVRNMTTTKKG
jgi:cobaltochelatase CobS